MRSNSSVLVCLRPHSWAGDWICSWAAEWARNWVVGCLIAKLGASLWQSHRMFFRVCNWVGDISQQSWELPHGWDMGFFHGRAVDWVHNKVGTDPKAELGTVPWRSHGASCSAKLGTCSWDPNTMWSSHLLSGSETKWTHFTLRCMCLFDCVLFFLLDPGTKWSSHLLLGSGTKWAHFTLRWMCLPFLQTWFVA
jgi:hypothetical protein